MASTAANPPSFLHLSRPLPPTSSLPQTTAPLSVTLAPTALLSILDHSTRRPPDTIRVIGTLLGTRSEDLSIINVTASFAVGHSESIEQVEVDMDYQKQMLQLHLRANPKEGVVGWYATSEELDTFSALIQNFYGGGAGVEGGTYPFPAVHLTVGCQPGKEVSVRTYISAPVGVTPERAADSAVFVPVPNTISWGEGERSGLELMAAAQDQPDRTAPTVTDIEGLERSLEQVLEMIERVSKYVEAVVDEEIDEPSTALGKFLLDTLSLQPVVGMGGEVEKDFNNHIQDTLAISFLANTIRTQIELANRLATATLTLGGGGSGVVGDVVGVGAEKVNGEIGSKGQRGGRGR